MASTHFRMIGVVLFVVALSALEAYEWDGGPEDKAKIAACLGGSASFPWSIVTGRDGETILNIDWRFQAQDTEKTQIATYESSHFYATDTVRVSFLPNAGLSLHYARPQDSGNYSVQVMIQQANSSLASAERTVTLSVTDRPPATQGGALHVTLSDAVRDDVTQDWTLQLHCGQFVDLGHPPVDVVWKTPSGEVRNSSYQDNGTFVLSVSSPVQGGNYSCQLPPSAPAARCLTANSPLNAEAQLYVDDKDAMLLLMDARLRELEHVTKDQAMQISRQIGTMADMVQVNKDQANLLQHQAMQISRQNGTMADMVQVNKDQAMQISQQNGTIEELTESLNDVLRGRIAANCLEWLKLDKQSGIRKVYISGYLIRVYCDQTTDNGGWIVFQRRQDASVDFYRNWTEYRNGFGDLEGNFWLGLDKLHRLTTSQRYEMRVDLQKWNGIKGYGKYRGFFVEDVSHNFTLRFDNYFIGSAGDSLRNQLGMQFTTKDRDHDTRIGSNCAQEYHGAWWYTGCFHSNLNADYKNSSGAPDYAGVIWGHFDSYSLKFTEMKIRPM